jgi:hypothetical protein
VSPLCLPFSLDTSLKRFIKSLGIHGDGERDADELAVTSHVTVSLPAARQGSEARSLDLRRDRDQKQKKRTNNQHNEEGTPPLGNIRKKRRMASED